MKDFMEWVRNRFTMVDMMHLIDIEDDTLKLLLFQNGPSRDEFIRFLVYKLLLDIDSEDSQNHNLEKIFVSFGLLDKDAAQQFIKGNMSTKVHMATWKRIIDALIPTTTITPQWNSYDDLVNSILLKTNHFRSVVKRNYLPPELIPKLKDQIISTENCETVEEISNDLIRIIKKPIKSDGNYSVESLSNSMIENKKPNCFGSKTVDVVSIKKEIDQYVQISKDNKLLSIINKDNSARMSPQEFLERTKQLDLIPDDYIESKVENIYKLMKAEQDLHILADSLANQVMLDNQLSQ